MELHTIILNLGWYLTLDSMQLGTQCREIERGQGTVFRLPSGSVHLVGEQLGSDQSHQHLVADPLILPCEDLKALVHMGSPHQRLDLLKVDGDSDPGVSHLLKGLT